VSRPRCSRCASTPRSSTGRTRARCKAIPGEAVGNNAYQLADVLPVPTGRASASSSRSATTIASSSRLAQAIAAIGDPHLAAAPVPGW
jgi:hypothetical protein